MITRERLEMLADRVAHGAVDEDLLPDLRQAHPDLHFTLCSDEEVDGPPPVVQRDHFNLYLVDSREHCLRITDDYAVATGVVLAARDLEEEDLD